ncbi:methionyl-tRNA formyltransferase [Synechococcus sp. MVIR-18-1]|uniref:methionyl-tRNA formyltransferase n=1 Tax=Synechococcus sp. MVIR-18-1 TaxID=1386941 RepID=UPI001646529D|nr:formyltransferase family protein [Synechococcus sp. MVIR-18-1]QNI75223.1 formyl transferase/ C-terminal domain protein [Synechococcus sp. MVIR-18-1]
MVEKLSIIPIGGTSRAVNTLRSLLLRDDIYIPLVIIMEGNQDDISSSQILANICSESQLKYCVINKVTPALEDEVKKFKSKALIGIGVWRPLLSTSFLNSTEFGFLAVHGTPLPRYRGWAGISWQIINGEDTVSLQGYQLSSGIDDGPLISRSDGSLLCAEIPLSSHMHLEDVFVEYEKCHIALVNNIINLLLDRELCLASQDESKASFSCHRGPSDGEINWNLSATEVFNFIRAQSPPYPCAFTYYKGKKVYILHASLPPYVRYEGIIAGKVISRCVDSGSVTILCNDGLLDVHKISVDGAVCSPRDFFISIRDRCKSRLEAFIDCYYPDF